MFHDMFMDNPWRVDVMLVADQHRDQQKEFWEKNEKAYQDFGV